MGSQLIEVACPLCDGATARPERKVNGYALVRCRACGMVYVNPQLDAEGLLEQYASREAPLALKRHYARVTTPARIAEYDAMLAAIERFAPARGRMLEIGCGAGYFLARAQARGWQVTGLDAAPWVAEAAAERGLADVRVATLAEAGLDSASFDVVVMAQVLEHLPRPREVLVDARRVLRPGALFYANVPNYRTLPILAGRDDFVLNAPMAHVNYFTPRTLAELCRRAGFTVLATSSFGGLKWENLVGRPYLSAEVRSAQGLPSDEQPAAAQPAANAALRASGDGAPTAGGWKRYLRPMLNNWLKLAMTLEVFARKGGDSPGGK
ncbi:MAG: methyltransferase domain-containing protein [Pirellulales bacterium]|nr:methyltransferase domain-containing protein [Pirellulales bacterium]